MPASPHQLKTPEAPFGVKVHSLVPFGVLFWSSAGNADATVVSSHVSGLPNISATSLGGLGAVEILGLISLWSGHVLMTASLGCSSVLLFGYPYSPLAQPCNVILGKLVHLSALVWSRCFAKGRWFLLWPSESQFCLDSSLVPASTLWGNLLCSLFTLVPPGNFCGSQWSADSCFWFCWPGCSVVRCQGQCLIHCTDFS